MGPRFRGDDEKGSKVTLLQPSAFGINAEDRIAHGDGPPELLEHGESEE